jgi:hypothetical protein
MSKFNNLVAVLAGSELKRVLFGELEPGDCFRTSDSLAIYMKVRAGSKDIEGCGFYWNSCREKFAGVLLKPDYIYEMEVGEVYSFATTREVFKL